MKIDDVRTSLGLLMLVGCSHPPIAPAPALVPPIVVTATSSTPVVTHLDPASRVPIIEREAHLIAAYVGITGPDRGFLGTDQEFLVLSHTGQIAKLDGSANKPGAGQPAFTQPLEGRVDTYLARGRWVAMHPATPEVVDGEPSWNLGGGLHLAFVRDTGYFRNDIGEVVGMPDESVHAMTANYCDRSKMNLKAAAYDAPTHLVWVAYVDPDGTDHACNPWHYFQVFYYFDPCSYDKDEWPQCKQPATAGGAGR